MRMPIRTWMLGLALLVGSGLTGCASDEPADPTGDDAADTALERVIDSSRNESFVAPEKRPGRPPQSQALCGTRGAKPCGAGSFCDFPAGSQCGATDQGGHCAAKPDACLDIYDPVCGCDGKTYGNECEAHVAGVDAATKGRCRNDPEPPAPPAGKMCAGFAGIKCGKGEFCNLEVEAGGLGCTNIADASGICQSVPQACTREYRPVCGCDGKTYGNKCTAHAAGVSVKQDGECGTLGKMCGGLAGAQCASGEFCNFEGHTNDCGAADGTGVCQAKPEVCAEIYSPVCGCDDKTYGNRCEANGKGVAVLHAGACEGDSGNSGSVSCDHRQVLCRRAEPLCPPGQVASVQGSCYGPCVKLEACTCSQEDQCPHREQYVCHKSAGHCGPYVR